MAGQIPVRRLAGGEGKVGEEVEEVETHLLVVSVGAGVDGGGGAAIAGTPARGVKGLWVWELQGPEENPFQGLIEPDLARRGSSAWRSGRRQQW